MADNCVSELAEKMWDDWFNSGHDNGYPLVESIIRVTIEATRQEYGQYVHSLLAPTPTEAEICARIRAEMEKKA